METNKRTLSLARSQAKERKDKFDKAPNPVIKRKMKGDVDNAEAAAVRAEAAARDAKAAVERRREVLMDDGGTTADC